MFNILRRFTLTQGRTCSTSVIQKNSPSVTFGDPRMPDKLYKTVELEVKGSEREVLRSYKSFITTAAKHLNITVGKVFSQRKPNVKRYTVLKSVFVHRKHLVQYEVRTHYVWVQLKNLTGSTADTFVEYIERMLPEGVGLKVTKISLEPLPEHLNSKSIQQSIETNPEEKEVPP